MKIHIEIACVDNDELLTHLSVIRTEIKRELKKQNYYMEKKVTITDNNCYGYHRVTIDPLK